jgi:hypothetical protein
MQRTREAAQQLEDDARAVVCWLDAEFPGLVVSIEVQRHHSCEDDHIAHVEPRVTERPKRHEVRDAAEKALMALGWSLTPEGRVDRVRRALSAEGFVAPHRHVP